MIFEDKKKHLISLCMIIKNEERYLDDCLQSVSKYVDQIVVVDTGSSDSSISIANRYDTEIHHFKWCDDFGAARNESIKYADGDWIFQVDADHRLRLERGFDLRKHLKNSHKLGYMMSEQSYYMGEKIQTLDRLLLFRNIEGLSYSGVIHESPFNSIKSYAEVHEIGEPIGYLENATVIHTGYDDPHQKLLRNYKILKSAVENEPDNLHYQYKLLLTLKQLHLNNDYIESLQSVFDSIVKIELKPTISTIGIVGLYGDMIREEDHHIESSHSFEIAVRQLGEQIRWGDVRIALPYVKLLFKRRNSSEAKKILMSCFQHGIGSDSAPIGFNEYIEAFHFMIRIFRAIDDKEGLVKYLNSIPKLVNQTSLSLNTIFERLAHDDMELFEYAYNTLKNVDKSV